MIVIRKAEYKDIDATVPEFSVNEETVTFWPKDILTKAVGSNDTPTGTSR